MTFAPDSPDPHLPYYLSHPRYTLSVSIEGTYMREEEFLAKLKEVFKGHVSIEEYDVQLMRDDTPFF
jgi:hypothetical protein